MASLTPRLGYGACYHSLTMTRSRPLRLASCLALVALAFTGGARAEVILLEAVRDTTLIESATGALANGAGEAVFVGRTGQPAGSLRRALVAFDVAQAIPAGATVTSAALILTLFDSNADPAAVKVHRLLAEWGEAGSSSSGGRGDAAQPGDATWIHRSYDREFWSQIGGDFAPVPSTSLEVDAPGDYAWPSTPEIVADVQGWVDGAPDHGWILLGDESASQTAKRFDSREVADPDRRPLLAVEFMPNQGCDAGGLDRSARALCRVYCELLDCDGEAPSGSAGACAAIARQFGARTGAGEPPCAGPAPVTCPCFTADEVASLIAAVDDPQTYTPVICIDTRSTSKPLTAVQALRHGGQSCGTDSVDCSALAFEFTEDRVCQLNPPAPAPGIAVQGISDPEREACRRNIVSAAEAAGIACN